MEDYENYLESLGYDPEMEEEARQLACYEDEQREEMFEKREMEYEWSKHCSWLSEEEWQKQQYEIRMAKEKEREFLPF